MAVLDLATVTYRTVGRAAGPLLFVTGTRGVRLGELASIVLPDGRERVGLVLDVRDDLAVVHLAEGTDGIDTDRTALRFVGHTARVDASIEMLGRAFDGLGRPADGGPRVLPEARLDVNGLPLNPYARDEPSEFIETGISAIDGLNSLVRGQKLPIFTGAGLPGSELAARIATHARVGSGEPFAVVFAAIGITHRESAFFRKTFAGSAALARTVVFLNEADRPALERILAPRYALTVAEHLAYVHGMHVLVILTDMTSYCEALRELAAAREEVPGRRGYPGYMYTDLATLYERAGRIRGRAGSVTQLSIVSMPDDDITHPIPDLTGYITEGQIVLSRDLHQRGIDPPIDVLPSLSRVMGRGIGPGKTREDHRALADQLYAVYAEGRELRRLEAILGEAALSARDRRYLGAATEFEREFLSQGGAPRALEETLDRGWRLLARLPRAELKRVPGPLLDRYHREEPAPAGTTAP